MEIFVREPGRTADPSAALGMTKSRVALHLGSGEGDGKGQDDRLA